MRDADSNGRMIGRGFSWRAQILVGETGPLLKKRDANPCCNGHTGDPLHAFWQWFRPGGAIGETNKPADPDWIRGLVGSKTMLSVVM